MKWFRENRFFGMLAIAFGVGVIGAIVILFVTRGWWDDASTRFANASTELNRLQRLTPYPSAENLRKMKAHTEDYASALGKLKEELKLRMVPAPPLKPNEFQSQLRVAINAATDKARTNKVKLPDKFYLGFDEFVAALPSESAAPLLGQELVQVEWIVNAVLEARVDAVTALRRPAVVADRTLPVPVKPGPTPAATPAPLERNVVELSFLSTPSASRKVINQIASATQHFYIIRQLHVRNEKQSGPPREGATENATPTPAPAPGAKSTPAAALSFIVGNEKIETTAKIEIVRFAF